MPQSISLKHLLRQFLSIASYYGGYCLLSEYLKINHGARILCYHGITETPTNQYAVSLTDFSWQMRFLAENYKIISVDQLFTLLQSGQLAPANTVALSIDDGFQDFYVHGFPILQKFGLLATVFLPTGSIDGSLISSYQLPQSKFLSWNQIRELHQKGIDFGSHTVSHPSLTKLTPQEIKYELEYSKTRIEAEIGVAVRGFAYPYGTFRDIDRSIDTLIAGSGYSWAVTTISGVNKLGLSPFALRRTVIVGVDGQAGFKRALIGALDGWVVIQKFGYYLDRVMMKNK